MIDGRKRGKEIQPYTNLKVRYGSQTKRNLACEAVSSP